RSSSSSPGNTSRSTSTRTARRNRASVRPRSCGSNWNAAGRLSIRSFGFGVKARTRFRYNLSVSSTPNSELRTLMTPPELADAYAKGAADLRAAVTGMTREQFVARPVPGRWSTLEVLCHLADFEPVFAERMKRIIALGPTPLLVAADEKLFTKELKYHD